MLLANKFLVNAEIINTWREDFFRSHNRIKFSSRIVIAIISARSFFARSFHFACPPKGILNPRTYTKFRVLIGNFISQRVEKYTLDLASGRKTGFWEESQTCTIAGIFAM